MSVGSVRADRFRGTSVLVVEREESVGDMLARGLRSAGYDVQTAVSGAQALELQAARVAQERPYAVLLTDIGLPGLRGDELQRIARQRQSDLAVLITCAPSEVRTARECLDDGAYDYMAKPYELGDVLARLRKVLEWQRLIRENQEYRRDLELRVAEQAERLRRTVQASLEALIQALEAKDPMMRDHSNRVATLGVALTGLLRPDDPDLKTRVHVAGLFHDIGKIGVPESLLDKPGKLSDSEMAVVRRHPEIGTAILAPVLDAEMLAMVRSHHEHVDGSGYPDGLVGSEICLGGRILAVAEAFDAMLSPRPHRSPLPRAQVLEILRAGAGRYWDIPVIEALLALEDSGWLARTLAPAVFPVVPLARAA
jgi:response regulator RpfG family c-di-GMP phosphodiesterase